MGLSPTDAMLGAWAPSTSPLRIEYTKTVMEEVRSRAVEGFYKLPRGGVEVAGLLVGDHEADHIRIVQQIPFDIEYAYGPTFMLSPRDLAFLRKLVEETREAVASLGHKVLGLYVSHSRGELSLKEVELGLYSEMFPHDWQTILLLKPSRAPETPAAFFVREPNGQVRANRSHQEFELSPEMGERRPRPEPRATRPQDASLRALASASARVENPGIPAVRDLGQDRRVPPALQRPPEESVAGSAPPPVDAAPASGQKHHEHEDELRQSASADIAVPPEKAARADQDSGSVAPLPSVQGQLAAEKPAHATAARAPASPVPVAAVAKPIEATGAVATPPDRRDAVAVPWEDEAPTASRRGILLRWAVPVGVLALAAVLGFLIYEALNTSPPAVVFYLQEVGDRTEVVWQLKGIRDASSAEITIETNGQRKTIDLMRSGQLSGTLSDPMLTAQSLVTLHVDRRSAPDILRVAPLLGSESPVVSLLDDGQPTASPRSDDADIPDVPLEDGVATSSLAPEAERDIAVQQQNPSADTAVLAAREEAARVAAETERLARMGDEARAAAEALAARTGGESTNGSGSTPVGSALPGASMTPPSVRELTAASASRQPASQSAATQPPLPSGGIGYSGGATQSGRVTPTAQQASRPNAPASGPDQSQAESASSPPGGSVGASAAKPAPTAPIPAVPKPVAAKPAVPSKAVAGRTIWTGQLRKNQTLQIMGADANRGTVTAALPGVPVRLNVLPGELTAKGLVVYTANPRYRNADDAIEPPGPTNGWNETRFVYDPMRANAIIVTAIPNQTNRWQALTVRNDDKSVNVIVIDWLADGQ